MKKLLLCFAGFCISLLLHAQVYKTVNLTTPGTLVSVLTTNELDSVTNLTVTGTINAYDFYIMYEMPLLAVINLRAANIVAYINNNGGTIDSTTYPRNTVPAGAFYHYPDTGDPVLDTIILPTTATAIGQAAFAFCTSLKSVTLPPSLISTNGAAFYNCTDLKDISLPSTLDSIGQQDFYKCISLTAINIPPSVTSIDLGAFGYCSSLDTVTMSAVTNIGDYAFDNCTNLTTITLPTSLVTIGKNAFNNTNLSAITIPSSTVSIGDSVFFQCSNLKSITVASSSPLTAISNSFCSECASLSTVTIPSSVTSIGKDAFRGSALTAVSLPSTITSIGDGAFEYCNLLDSLSLPASTLYIGNGAFEFCNGLKGKLTIPSSVTTIGAFGFYGCLNLSAVTIPASVTSIGNAAFAGDASYFTVDSLNADYSSLKGVIYNKTQTTLVECPTSVSGNFIIPSTVLTVGFGGFGYCSKLTSITIPASVDSIKSNAFYACTGLQSITVNSKTPVPVDSSVFVGVDPNNCTLYVPAGSKSAYLAAPFWQNFVHIFEVSGLWISDSTISLANDAGSMAGIYVGSNLTWAVTNSSPSWLTINPNSTANGNDSILFTATANTTGAARLAIVTVSANGITDTITVTQNTTLLIAKSVVYLAKDSGSQATVFVTSNTNWKAKANQSWVNLYPADTTGNNYLYISAQKNLTDAVRMATVTLSANGVASQTITVYQAGDTTKIIVSMDSVTESASANSDKSITVTSNASWTASSKQSWLTVSPDTTTVGNGTLTFTVSANTTNEIRIDTVIISAVGVGAQTIIVTQNGATTSTEVVKAYNLSLYPNPASSYFCTNAEDIATVEIYSLDGTCLLSKPVFGNEKIYTSSLPAGFYLVKIKTDKAIATKTLIVK